MALKEQIQSDSKVFISYSRKNRDFALRLVESLKANNLDVWIDLDAIPPSAEWWAEIKNGIDQADTFVPILTPEMLSSAVCTFEMDYAIKNNKRIIPLMRNEAVKAQTFANIAAVEPTGFLAEILGDDDLLELARSNWRVVDKLNWIFSRDDDSFDHALEQLVEAVATDLGRVRLHTRLLIRANEWDARGRDESVLIGNELREAVDWLNAYGDTEPKATILQRAFIQASLEKESADQRPEQNLQRRALNRTRLLAFSLSIFLVLALILGGFALDGQRQAEENAGTALARGTEVANQVIIAGNNAVTATIAQGQAEQNAATALARGTEVANQVIIADNNAVTATIAQGLAEDNAATALARGTEVAIQVIIADNNAATALAEANERATQQYIAEISEATAVAAQATSEYRANEVQSIFLANSANDVFANGDGLLALALAMQATEVENPSASVYNALANIAYQPGMRNRYELADDVTLRDMVANPVTHTVLLHSRFDNALQVLLLVSGEYASAFTGHERLITSFAWHPSGMYVLSAEEGGKVLMWEPMSGEIIQEIVTNIELIENISLNDDGSLMLLSGCQTIPSDNTCTSGVLELWDLDSTSLVAQNILTGQHVQNAVLTSDGATAIVLTRGEARLWQWTIADNSMTNIVEGETEFFGLVAGPNDRFAAISRRTALIFDKDGSVQDNITVGDGIDQAIEDLAFIDERSVVTAGCTPRGIREGEFFVTCNMQDILFWQWGATGDWDQFYRYPLVLETSTRIQQVASGQSFITAGCATAIQDFAGDCIRNEIVWWDSGYGNQVYSTYAPQGSMIRNIEISPSETEVLEAQAQIGFTVRSLSDASIIRQENSFMRSNVHDVALSADGSLLAYAGCNTPGDSFDCIVGEAGVFDVATGDILYTVEHEGWEFESVAINRQNTMFAAATQPGELRFMNMETGQETATSVQQPCRTVVAMAFNADGSLLVGGCASGEVIIWDVQQMRQTDTLSAHTGTITDVVFNPEGDVFASSSVDSNIILWDSTTLTEKRRLVGHESDVDDIDFAQDGRILVSGSEDQTIILWDTTNGSILQRLPRLSSRVLAVDITQDGRHVLIRYRNGFLIYWRIDTLDELIEWVNANRYVREFTCGEREAYRIEPLCGGRGR